MKKQKNTIQLSDLMNVGKATLQDLHLLNIHTVEQLAMADPDELYIQIEVITKQHHDPCVWNIFAAIIHEARTGEKTRWGTWSPVRKQKEIVRPLCPHVKKKQ